MPYFSWLDKDCGVDLVGDFDGGWVCEVVEGNGHKRTLTNVRDQRWTETADTGATVVTDAGIHDAGRPGVQQFAGEALRGCIAIRIEVRPVSWVTTANVVKLRTKIGEVLAVGARFRTVPGRYFAEFFGEMKSDLVASCLEFKTGVPAAAVWTVEAAAVGLRVGKAGIDDPIMRNTEHELVDGDSG